MKHICGIYFILNKITKKVYVGQSINIHKRWFWHLCYLRKGKHHNKYLQNSWNKYGEGNFIFLISHLCLPTQLSYSEQKTKEYFEKTVRSL